MNTKILNGREVSQNILSNLKTKISELKNQKGKEPCLAVIMVGGNPASETYVNMKKKACRNIGVKSLDYKLAENAGETKLAAIIKNLNQDPDVNGILLQLPLPKGYDEQKILDLILPQKDVDGFHPQNIGKLLLGLPTIKSCTPAGVCKLLEYYNIETKGRHIVILGRSNIVGKPLAAMLVQKGPNADATVTICHSQTKNMNAITKQADILIAAIGKPLFVKPSMVKKSAVVIDVGTNRVPDKTSPKGYKLVGDVDFETVLPVAKAVTPSPGGIGPMTIAILMQNTYEAFCTQNQL